MKLAFLTDGVMPYVLGGMQRHSTLLASELARQGTKVHLFHTVFSDSQVPAARQLSSFPDEVRRNLHSHLIPYPKPGKLPGHYIRNLKIYSQNILSHYQSLNIPFDFIYANSLTAHAFLQNKQTLKLPPIGINAHGYEMFQKAASLRNKLEHQVLRPTFRQITQEADYVFSFGGQIRKILETKLAIPSNRILQIPIGVSSDWIVHPTKRSSTPVHFLYVGRYERRKGIEELYQAIQLLDDSLPFQFTFVGPIPANKQFQHPKLHYAGSVIDEQQLKLLFDQADVLVCPSYAEGMPNVIMEAMARGLAIIATDVGAISEVVGHDNGILLPTPNKKLIAQALLKCIQMPYSEIHTRKQQSLQKIKHYTWDQIASLTLQKIQECIESSSLHSEIP